MLVKMSALVTDNKNVILDSNKCNNDIESEKRLDFENLEKILNAEHSDLKLETANRDCLDVTGDPQNGECKPEPQKIIGKSESEKDECKSESDKVEFKTESDDSDIDSERSQAGSELYDRLNDVKTTGCGDGIIDLSIPACEEPIKSNVKNRKARGLQDSGSVLKESFIGHPQISSTKGIGDCKKDEASGDSIPCPKPVSGITSVKSATPPSDWVKYITPKSVCLIILSFIYLGFTIFGIKVLNLPSNST